MFSKLKKYADNAFDECKPIRNRLYPRGTWPDDRFREEILRLASRHKTIVDLGCGRRAVLLRSIVGEFLEGYGVDLDISGQIHESNIHLLRGDLEKIPLPDESVDVVTSVHVLEHLQRPAGVFRECRRILRPGGSILFMAPSKWHPPVAIARLFPHWLRQRMNRLATKTEYQDTFPAFYRANTQAVVERLAVRAGLTPMTIEYVSGHPEYFMFSPALYRCAAAVERMIAKWEALAWLRRNIFLHARRCSDGEDAGQALGGQSRQSHDGRQTGNNVDLGST